MADVVLWGFRGLRKEPGRNVSEDNTLTVVIPAYNEEVCLPSVVAEWHAVVERIGGTSRLMVLNDGSRDGSLGVLRELSTRMPRLDVVDMPNSGHGPTCLAGYKRAIAGGAGWVFQTDSDGQTDPGEFWPLWGQRSEAPFHFGCRGRRGDGAGRWVIARVLRLTILAIFGVVVRDANVPFRLMHAETLRPFLRQIPDDFFLANALLTVLLVQAKEPVRWYPITFRSRQGGVASVNYPRFVTVGCRVIRDFWAFRHANP